MKKTTCYVLIMTGLVALTAGCKKENIPMPLLLPHKEGSEIKYVCYITNTNRELQHEMTYLTRHYVRTDSSTSNRMHYYIENNRVNRYLSDPEGALWQEIKLDLAIYTLDAGFPYRASIPYTYWKPIFKKHKGMGTQWRVQVDTTFAVADSSNQLHTIQFGFSGDAQLDGWTRVTVPARRDSALQVLNVHWKTFSQYLYDHTSGDSIWVQRGEGRDLFSLEFGLTRSMSDFSIKRKNQPAILRKSTMDLYYLLIPSR